MYFDAYGRLSQTAATSTSDYYSTNYYSADPFSLSNMYDFYTTLNNLGNAAQQWQSSLYASADAMQKFAATIRQINDSAAEVSCEPPITYDEIIEQAEGAKN